MLMLFSISLNDKRDGPIFNVIYKQTSLRINLSEKITDFHSIMATAAQYFALPKD